jgi:hypothetical protein
MAGLFEPLVGTGAGHIGLGWLYVRVRVPNRGIFPNRSARPTRLHDLQFAAQDVSYKTSNIYGAGGCMGQP